MHYHMEVIMPKTKDIGTDLEQILKPFCEHNDEREGHEFWDFYVIGGRFAGTKETCGLNEKRLDGFYAALRENKVTVSGVIWGKQEISPASQIPLVDKLWADFFPTEDGQVIACPLFAHSNNQYDSDDLLGCDICLVEDIPDKLTAERVIIAGPTYDGKGLEAHYMISDNAWDGVIHMPVDWDGNVKNTIELFKKHIKNYRDEWKEKVLPKADWLCVTVDYHN